jgi:regulator of replication initiation timing
VIAQHVADLVAEQSCPVCGPGECDEVCELATELIEERRLHQATIDERDRLKERIAKGYPNIKAYLDECHTKIIESTKDRDRLANELADAKRDADRGWDAAEREQTASAEWAATCKRLMAHVEQLEKLLAPQRGACGVIVSTVEDRFGPCTIAGRHHTSFPHQDAAGVRWLVLTIPAGVEQDDMAQRLEAAYYARFDNDGHPEDSTAAAEVALSVLGPELDRLAARVGELETEVAKRQQYLDKLREQSGKNYGDACKLRRRLDEERDAVRAHCEETDAAEARAAAADAKLARVRELHRPVESGAPCIPDHGVPAWCPGCAEVCATCRDEGGNRAPYPCATVQTIDDTGEA